MTLVPGRARLLLQPFEDSLDDFLEPGTVEEFVQRSRVAQCGLVFLLETGFVEAAKAAGGMTLPGKPGAAGAGAKMLEGFEQQVSEPPPARSAAANRSRRGQEAKKSWTRSLASFSGQPHRRR